MRRFGLIMMVGLLLAAGGVGLGWLAAELELDGGIAADDAIGAEAPRVNPASAVRAADAAKDLQRADPTPLRVAAEQAGSLEAEIARLRWHLADQRRDCQPAAGVPDTEPHAVEAEVAAAADGPRSLIFNPQQDAQPDLPAVADLPPAPAFAPVREPAPPPVRLSAAEPVEVSPPVAPPAAVPPPAPPTYQPGQALTVPEAAVRSGDVGFLEGCWVSSPFSNPVNGVASTKVYCFDGNGNGQMNFRGNDGVTCNAPIRARWEPGRRLVLEEPRDGLCSNYGPWYRESTNCSIGGDGRAQCNSYEFYRRFNYGTRLTRS